MSMRNQFERPNNAYAGATEAEDAEALSRLFTDDAILPTPGNPPAIGLDSQLNPSLHPGTGDSTGPDCSTEPPAAGKQGCLN